MVSLDRPVSKVSKQLWLVVVKKKRKQVRQQRRPLQDFLWQQRCKVTPSSFGRTCRWLHQLAGTGVQRRWFEGTNFTPERAALCKKTKGELWMLQIWSVTPLGFQRISVFPQLTGHRKSFRSSCRTEVLKPEKKELGAELHQLQRQLSEGCVHKLALLPREEWPDRAEAAPVWADDDAQWTTSVQGLVLKNFVEFLMSAERLFHGGHTLGIEVFAWSKRNKVSQKGDTVLRFVYNAIPSNFLFQETWKHYLTSARCTALNRKLLRPILMTSTSSNGPKSLWCLLSICSRREQHGYLSELSLKGSAEPTSKSIVQTWPRKKRCTLH